MTQPSGVQGFTDTRLTALAFVDFTCQGDWRAAQALLHQHDDPDYLREVIVALTRLCALELQAHHGDDLPERIAAMRGRLMHLAALPEEGPPT